MHVLSKHQDSQEKQILADDIVSFDFFVRKGSNLEKFRYFCHIGVQIPNLTCHILSLTKCYPTSQFFIFMEVENKR